MAAPDPKLAPLSDELKEFALTLERTVFPKTFFCTLCDQLAFDSFKLLCCNKVICSPCHANLEFPTTCPSCDHSPVESDSCPPNKTIRNTMRIWLQKQKKKEETKAASEAATPAVEPAQVSSEVQSATDAADKPVDSVEVAFHAGDSSADQNAADGLPDNGANQREGNSAAAPDDAPGDDSQDIKDGVDGKETGQSVEAAEGHDDSQTADGSNGPMNPNNANGTPNQFGFGFNGGPGNFGMGMGMGSMNNMSNMMNPGWNNMGYGMNNMNNMNGMFGYGGNMAMGMNDMSGNYGGGFGNGWNGMGGGGYGFNGYNSMAGYNQGGYTDMNYAKNSNRYQGNGPGGFQNRNNRNGSFGYGQGAGTQQNSRPGSRSGIKRDGQSPAGTADPALDKEGDDEQVLVSTEDGPEGKGETTAVEEEGNAQAAQAEDEASQKGSLTTAENEVEKSSGLNQIQTVDSIESNDGFDPSMMGGNMPMQFSNQMMNHFHQQQMNGPFNHMGGMGNMGHHNNNSFGPRGGFNNAYGAATVLTGEPRGVGVEGAPTGPRAMREGRPNTGFSSRAYNMRNNTAHSATPATEAAPGSRSPPRRRRSQSPVRDENLRTKDKSPSRSRAGSQAKITATEETYDETRPAELDRQDEHPRSTTPRLENDGESEHRRDKRRHRSSRYDEYDELDARDGHDERGRDDRDSRGSRGDRTRSASLDSKYRSRRDKDKDRPSRSHRDRSREHRRRHYSRSRSPPGAVGDEDYYNDKEGTSRRKDRRDRDKHRDRSRDRDRDRDRDRERDRKERKDREYDREHDEDRYRSRDKDRDRRRRRDRGDEEEEREFEDDRHRSSRRSRKDRDRDRDYDKDATTSTRAVSPPVNAPTGPSADNFSIRGASKPKGSKSMPPPQPPTGPRGLAPPKGPAADRDRSSKHGRKRSTSSSVTTPVEPTVQDHYAAEREKNARARDMLERGNPDRPDRSLHSRISSQSHHSSSSRLPSSSKRSLDDYDDDERENRNVPTGPSGDRSKRRKSGSAGGADLANAINKGLRKKAGAPHRRGGVKTEGDVERELERVERERDGRRW